MNNSITISTTNHIENTQINSYLGTLTSHVVFGTNFFSDFAASFTDVFGGKSGTYQRKLERLYQTAINQLKDQAYQIGANAIIGLKVDFDEISGKGKSMFMVTAIGTAVKITYNSNIKIQDETTQPNVISIHSLEIRLEQQRLMDKFESNNLLTQDEWNFLFENPTDKINDYLLDLFVADKAYMMPDDKEVLRKNICTYFGRVDTDVAIQYIYNKLADNEGLIKILEFNNLLSLEHVLDYLNKDNVDIAISCLLLDKTSYVGDVDIPIMENVMIHIDNLRDLGEVKTVKGGMISKDKEKYICPNGHHNNLSVQFCEKCGKNIKGLTESQIKIIDKFKNKLTLLKEIIEG